MNDEIILLNRTPNTRINNMLSGIIGLCELALPGRMRAYWLTGSHTDGSAVAASDIDIEIVLKGEATDAERAIIEAVGRCCGLVGPLQIDLTPVSEYELDRQTGEGPYSALSIKTGGLLLYGEDTAGRIPLPPLPQYLRTTMHSVPEMFVRLRQDREKIIYPLDYPDPDGAFYGYDGRWMRTPDGAELVKGTKHLMVSACWAGSALLARQAGLYATRKSDVVRLYRQHINDEWAALLEAINAQCRLRWGYLVPEDESERAALRELCGRALAFENHFLRLYRAFLLDELRGADPAHHLEALRALCFVIYPGDGEVRAAVESFVASDDAELRRAAALAAGTHPGDSARWLRAAL